jgi:glycosyltransferase involved in cell wall biosynthesis
MKCRVLYLEGSGAFLGGGQISLYKLLEKLDRTVVDPILLCPAGGSFASSVADLGIPVLMLPLSSPRERPMSSLKEILHLRKLVRELQPDLIHANTSRAMLYGGLSTLTTKIPVVWHVRVIESEGWYDRLLSCLSKRIFTCSGAVAARFDWLAGRKAGKVRVIYNGVDLREFGPSLSGTAVRKAFNLRDENLVVGVVGNLLAWKGQDTFLRAAAIVAREVPRARFLIVGEGEYRGELEKLSAQLGLRSKVYFTGHRTDIPQMIAAMDVAVHCSNSPEPFARVVIEAMASGKPVVAMNEGGVLEIIEDGLSGVLVPPREPSLLASAIIELLLDPGKSADLGRASRRRIENHFSIETNVKKTTEEYMKILSRRRHNHSRPALFSSKR